MRILVLGGGRFAGKHFTDAAIAAGHNVTHFNRGQSSAPRQDVTTVLGDRTLSLDGLADGHWDWVFDTCGYLPRIVELSARFLRPLAPRYAFVSSISVYSDFSKLITEDSPVAKLEDEAVEEITGETYGGLKALCEQRVADSYGGDCLIVRPGMIVGPNDPTDRFTYWVWRAAQKTPMAAPGSADLPMQFIDVRDLGDWMLRQMENDVTGVFNVTGEPTTFGEVLRGGDVSYLSGDEFRSQGVDPGGAFAWFTEGDDDVHAWDVDIAKAVKTGLELRSVAETVRDTVAWAKSRVEDHTWRSGLSLEDEAKLLNLTELQV